MSTYKTPGVYVEEISLFPPSVAAVETAIPAFIGYTAKAKKYADNDLKNVPTKIGSVLDFVEKFGGAPDVGINKLELNAQNQVAAIELTEQNYLYECIRMFYANGGSYCYIVSVGLYGENIQNGDGITPGFIKGLDAVRKVDEPTILLAPDAALMNQADMNSLHQAMLKQCNELQDRFSIFDLREVKGSDHPQVVEDFRNGIGMNSLKYGAAYTPWIRVNLPRSIKYSSIKDKITKNGATVVLDTLVADPDSKALAKRLDNLILDRDNIKAAIKPLFAGATTIDNKFESLFINLKTSSSANAKANLEGLIQFFVTSIDVIKDVIDAGSSIKLNDAGVAGDLADFLFKNLDKSQNATLNEIKKIVDDSAAAPLPLSAGKITITPAASLPATTPSVKTYFGVGTNDLEKIQPHIAEIGALWSSISSALNLILSSAEGFVATIETAALEAIPALKTIYRAIESELLVLPPSAAIAGIYAQVDNNRGVWKAPANVSINNVVATTQLIDNREQAGLNVDTVAGKSINVIRNFTGKGILVWGARTLAGNDNEWRYISVRRFFNFAEESIKKASEQFVFEPNDANTWIKVRAMIENFLTLQWRQGALAGAKPTDAFFVRIGLGQTMTSIDILEGRMNVEIGMAVVRPAEFIILKFSHKMQES